MGNGAVDEPMAAAAALCLLGFLEVQLSRPFPRADFTKAAVPQYLFSARRRSLNQNQNQLPQKSCRQK